MKTTDTNEFLNSFGTNEEELGLAKALSKVNQYLAKDNYNKGYTDGYTAAIDTIKLAGIEPIDDENKTMDINNAVNCIVDYCKKHREQNCCDRDKCSMYNYCFNYGIKDWGYVKEINGEIKE